LVSGTDSSRQFLSTVVSELPHRIFCLAKQRDILERGLVLQNGF